MKKIINVLIVLFILFIPANIYAEDGIESNLVKYVQSDQKKLDNVPETELNAVYIAEPHTGKIIYEKNAHEKMFPASTTKILTALITLEKCKLTDTTTVSKNAIDMVPYGYSTANLQEGEELTIKDLLYALLLPSANEAANVLAEHISGSVEAFAELCNNRAKELGCENLHFVNPNGIHDDNHYCTAYDLYLIATECRKYEIFNEIVKTASYTIPMTNVYNGTRTLKNTNELLPSGTYYYAYCTGIKTGYTTPAGECLVASSLYNDMEFVSVVLGGYQLNSRFYETRKLFEFAYNSYSIKKIADYGDIVATVTVGKGTKDTSTLDVVVNADISTIVPNDIEKENILSTISINDNIVAPIEQNQVLGQIRYCADGLVYSADIIASHSVEKLPYALYNSIVIAVIVVVLGIFAIILKKFKRHRKGIFVFEIIIIIGACIAIYPFVEKEIESSKTVIIPANNVTLESKLES